ncbi:uncharacterized protein LAJ45_05314 [Morchella importuna]|uniref:uncharacterized protein n=1 Tax=Morchella importuna TaxID=1174673 RepID=UPI001E8E5BB0|nr:uncharacterized protein LAJ45_05314 [Morchella importuna]KAH8150618.1 hypothetical protein LAJ45_05314 [Morchella importuna]
MPPRGNGANPWPPIPAAPECRILKDEVPLPENHNDGYFPGQFPGKDEQMFIVMNYLEGVSYIPDEFIERETESFYKSLGIDDSYFKTETVENVANNILSLYAAKVHSFSRKKVLDICFATESQNHAVFFDSTEPGVSVLSGARYEQLMDTKYLDGSTPKRSWRLESFRSRVYKLRCYFLYLCEFANPTPLEGETDLDVISDKTFLEKVTPNTRRIYQEIINSVVRVTGPVIKMVPIKREMRLVIGFKQGTTMGLFSALSDLYHHHGCTSLRKYVEHFSNGVTIICIYLASTPDPECKFNFPPIEVCIEQIVREVSLLNCIPQNLFQAHFMSGKLSLQESIYAHCVCHFVGHFLNRFGSELGILSTFLDPANTAHAELMSNLKRRFSHETFNADYIFKCVKEHPALIHALYLSFASKHYIQPRRKGASILKQSFTSSQLLKGDPVLTEEELNAKITTSVRNEDQERVMKFFITFNKHVLKTNFYTPTKVALSFRICPSFLPAKDYPQPLFGMFMVLGSEFRGFHLRFRDIARGGIRIVKSRNEEVYTLNSRSVFDENYNLANTQNRKNKDIPEGGAKGVILLDANHQDKEVYAFEKYIDAILDLVVVGDVPGIKEPLVDYYKKPETLFMGPDENTAGLVDWATTHAKRRKAPFWKSFFTGKSASLGGMPHDIYGMTSLGVREYVLGIYNKLGIDQRKMLKLQTGGPDGDLGSNEILLSSEKYGAIVDGSGVIVDPKGLNRDELERLATKRLMVSNFDVTLLSEVGYRVLLDDVNLRLPDGEIVPNGTIFRNTFHLRSKLLFDIFVPCGGRPESINLSNVGKLIGDGECTIPYIVEGANLFISQDAKLRLEEAGAILIKDASANKGGVTSSSMEVLASLAFTDAEFTTNMCVIDGITPSFYTSYVKAVQDTIRENARLEFEALWHEKRVTGKKFSVLSDELSMAIIKLDEEIRETDLWKNLSLRRSVIKEALPACLINTVGLEVLLKRVPVNYTKAIFGSYLASRFIYEYGANSNQFSFFNLWASYYSEILPLQFNKF